MDIMGAYVDSYGIKFFVEENGKELGRAYLYVLRNDLHERPFGLLEDAKKVRALGLAKGASLENTLVYDKTEVLNTDGLRYEDECVRHKVLDVMGDLHLAGGLILGKFQGVRTGHELHRKLLLALFSDPTAWTVEVR